MSSIIQLDPFNSSSSVRNLNGWNTLLGVEILRKWFLHANTEQPDSIYLTMMNNGIGGPILWTWPMRQALRFLAFMYLHVCMYALGAEVCSKPNLLFPLLLNLIWGWPPCACCAQWLATLVVTLGWSAPPCAKWILVLAVVRHALHLATRSTHQSLSLTCS